MVPLLDFQGPTQSPLCTSGSRTPGLDYAEAGFLTQHPSSASPQDAGYWGRWLSFQAMPSTSTDSQLQKIYGRWKDGPGMEQLPYSPAIKGQQEQGKVMGSPSELFTLTLSSHSDIRSPGPTSMYMKKRQQR